MQDKQWFQTVSVGQEASSQLGDVRRSRRLNWFLQRLSQQPQASLPQVFKTKSDLEASYRLVEGRHIQWEQIQAGHTCRTLVRCQTLDDILVLHDTTDISFKIHDPERIRCGLALVSSRTQGLCWHAAIAVSDNPRGLPLGLLASQPFVHRKHVQDQQTQDYWQTLGGLYNNESQRWFDQVQKVRDSLVSTNVSAIHIMDCEADKFSLLGTMHSLGDRFVVRAKSHSRRLANGDTLEHALKVTPCRFRKSVKLGFRSPLRSAKKRKTHPPRKTRKALLEFRATMVTIKRPQPKDQGYVPDSVELPRMLTLNVVEAFEPNPPKGQEAVHWILWTTEPIQTVEQILQVIDRYRKRWLIEEFFKAIKTGCSLEKRQMRNADNILLMLSVSAILGWWLLLVRELACEDEKTSWTVALTPLAFDILRHSRPKAKLNQDSTVSEVLCAIASLGGHLKHNGSPGWQTLNKGMTTLAGLVEGAAVYASILGHNSDEHTI